MSNFPTHLHLSEHDLLTDGDLATGTELNDAGRVVAANNALTPLVTPTAPAAAAIASRTATPLAAAATATATAAMMALPSPCNMAVVQAEVQEQIQEQLQVQAQIAQEIVQEQLMELVVEQQQQQQMQLHVHPHPDPLDIDSRSSGAVTVDGAVTNNNNNNEINNNINESSVNSNNDDDDGGIATGATSTSGDEQQPVTARGTGGACAAVTIVGDLLIPALVVPTTVLVPATTAATNDAENNNSTEASAATAAAAAVTSIMDQEIQAIEAQKQLIIQLQQDADDRISWFNLAKYPSGTSFAQISRHIEGQLVSAQLARVIVFLATTILLMSSGRHGDSSVLGGIGVSISISNIAGFSVAIGILGAIDTLVSQSVGRGARKEAGEITMCGMAVAFGMCCIFAFVLFFFSDFLVATLYGEKFVPIAGLYLRLSILQISAYSIQAVISFSLQAERKADIVFKSSVAGLAAAVFGAFFLIPWWGPSVGMSLSLAGVYIIQLIVNLILAPSDCVFREVEWFSLAQWKSACQLERMKTFLKIGFESYVTCALEWISFECFVMVSSRAGATAALSVLVNLSTISWCVAGGSVSQTSSAFVGSLLGANSPSLAKAYSRVFSIWGSIVAAGMATIFASQQLFGPWIFRMYTTDADVISYLMRPEFAVVYFLHTQWNSLEFVMLGHLRGVRRIADARWPCIAGMWIVGLAMATIALNLGLGIVGTFLGFGVGCYFFAGLMFWQLSRWDWKQMALEASRLQIDAAVDKELEQPQQQQSNNSSIPTIVVVSQQQQQ